MNYYFACFIPDAQRKEVCHAIFPDLPGCITCGSGLEDCLKQAIDALSGYMEVEIDNGEDLPSPSNLSDATDKCEAILKKHGMNLPANAIFQLVAAEPKIAAPESLTIWMQRGLWAAVKRLAREKQISISQLIAIATREYIKREVVKEPGDKAQ